MSELLTSLTSIVLIFDEYAGKDGDNKTLTKAEVKDLFQGQLLGLLGYADDQAAVDEFFSDLDTNKDNLVDLPEFLHLLGDFALAFHDCIIQVPPCSKQ